MNSLSVMQLPAALEAWTGFDTRLMVVAALGIALIVVLITKFKLHPFLALILGSAFVGLAAGVEPALVIKNFEDGVGGVLKEVGLLIAISAVKSELGTTPALGPLVAVPTVIICGPLFSRRAPKWVPVGAPAIAGGIDTVHGADLEGVKRRPSFLVTLLTINFPVVLMLLKAVMDIIWPDTATAPGSGPSSISSASPSSP